MGVKLWHLGGIIGGGGGVVPVAGDYTPAMIGILNVGALVAGPAEFQQVDTWLTVRGLVAIDAVVSGNLTTIQVFLPAGYSYDPTVAANRATGLGNVINATAGAIAILGNGISPSTSVLFTQLAPSPNIRDYVYTFSVTLL